MDAKLLKAIQTARDLRHDDELEASQELLLDLMAEHPDEPLVLFEVGGSYDVLGEEESAIPYYRKAIDAGLADGELQECLVCLGSSLRVVGETEEAVEVLEQAVADFPERRSSRAFLALAYLSDGRADQAVAALLDLLLDTTEDDDILSYRDALEYYRDELNDDAGDDE